MTTALDFTPATRLRAADSLYLMQDIVGTPGTPGATGTDKNLTLGLANQPYVFISQMTDVSGDADLSNAALGTDDSAAIQAGINAAPVGSVFVIDGAFKAKELMARSNDTFIQLMPASWYGGGLAPTCGFIQAPASQCLFRNVHWTSAYNSGSPVTDFSTIVDHDIKFVGVFINGNKGNGGVNNVAGNSGNPVFTGLPDAYHNPSLLPISTFTFFGVRNLTIENCFVYDPPQQAVLVGYYDEVHIRVKTVDPTVYLAATAALTGSSTGGGIRLQGTGRNATIPQITGYTGWIEVDLVADAFFNTQNVAITTDYYSVVYPGPITNTTIEQLEVHKTWLGYRQWSGANAGSGGSTLPNTISPIDKTVVKEIIGSVFGSVFNTDGPSSVIGSHGNVEFNSVNVTVLQGADPVRFLSMEGDFTRLIVDKINLDMSNVTSLAAPFTGATLFWFNPSATGNREVSINRLTVYDPNSLTYDIVQNIGKAGTFGITNSRITTAGHSHALYHAPTAGSGAVSVVQVANTVVDGPQNVFLYECTNIDTYIMSNVSHRNANGGATVVVGNTKTLARLRTGCMDCAILTQLVGTGTVTSHKTDGTEDLYS